MGIDKLPIADLLIEHASGATPPKDTSNKEPIDQLQPNLTGTPDLMVRNAHMNVVGVYNVGVIHYCNAT
jgi:hypothetical protein